MLPLLVATARSRGCFHSQVSCLPVSVLAEMIACETLVGLTRHRASLHKSDMLRHSRPLGSCPQRDLFRLCVQASLGVERCAKHRTSLRVQAAKRKKEEYNLQLVEYEITEGHRPQNAATALQRA